MLGGLFVYPTGTLRSTALRWDSEAKRKGSADEKVGKMAQESDITAAHRCDDQEPQETKIRAFVPPRPRDLSLMRGGWGYETEMGCLI